MLKKRIWIDTDPAVTAGNGEVDDAFALIQALKSPELDIIGISAVHGNADVDHCYAMAQEIVHLSERRDIPVYKGCAHPDDKAEENAATKALAQAINAGPLTIVALGPASNVAAGLVFAQEAIENVDAVIFVGGRRPGQVFRATPSQVAPFQDLNFELDPEALDVCLRLGAPLVYAGWEVSSKLWITPDDIARLQAASCPSARWLGKHAEPWLAKWQQEFKASGFTPFDCLAVGWLLTPILYKHHAWYSKIHMVQDTPQLLAGPKLSGQAVVYLSAVDTQLFHSDLMARLCQPSC